MGISRGVDSMASSLVEGSMGAVSSITGGWYNVIKNTTGQKSNIKEKDGKQEGLMDGVAGGAEEIVSGVTGIFTAPVQEAKKGGIGGFFTGVGKGLIGAVSAPVTAVLRVGSAATGELASTVKGKRRDSLGYVIKPIGRIRQPRYISQTEGLKSFDEEMSFALDIITQLNESRDDHFSKAIVGYCEIPRTEDSDGKPNHMIETDKHIIYVSYKDYKILFMTLKEELSAINLGETAGGKLFKLELKTNTNDRVKI
jgi:vacuolar protein sorting-associated protein 13A/C